MLRHLKSVSFRLIEDCHQNCSFCHIRRATEAEKRKKKLYLEIDELKSIIDKVAKYIPQIYLWGGGETLLYPYLKEFILYMRSKKLSIFIGTNADYLEKYYKFFVDSKVSHLTIPIDGPKECFEKIRATQNIFEKTINGIKKLQKYKIEANKVLPVVDIKIEICDENYTQLAEFCDYLLNLNAIHKIRVQLPMFIKEKELRDYKNYIQKIFGSDLGTDSWKSFDYRCTGIDMEIMNKQLKLISQKKKVELFPVNANPLLWLHNPEINFKKKYCISAYRRLNVEPNGDVVACTDFPGTVYGNILEESVEKLFNNSIINKHRQAIRQGQLSACSRCSYLYLY